MKRFLDIIVIVVKWLIRRKRLYRIAGFASVTYMFIELNNADIPTEAEPNYAEIGEKYGETVKAISGWLVNKFGSGINWLGIAVALIILLICLLIEFNVLKPQKVINAKNIFSGWFTINIQTNHYDKE
ncbi:hypothetical protein [Nonlabens ulvanivorans]|uniref:Uncharacterized protein n=1 Tax=Nonlabens ulvanivorans TaxID=906888 RepID=A0A084JX66_NONUL|nr:hypothetical protein [Nonlabens ulvanivorans]KEZ93550.1 hypothetical protein IL45_04895 [Nonlabens ulvanivorans]PRX14127.1 hypothetical protein LY02_01156 [Nonlabens ulvanivorans]